MCVSETRLKGNPLINIAIPSYNFVHADSVTNAGGVGVYVLSKFRFQADLELNLNLNGCEEIWLNLITEENLSTKITIGAMYRHPNVRSNDIEEFSETLCNTIHKITKRNGIFYLLGDINIDLNISKRSMGSSLYLEHLTNCGSLPIITIPTRVTENSSTIIDHIITNDYSHIINPGVIRCDNELSDHYVVFCTINKYLIKSRKQPFFTIRDKSNFEADAYCEEMDKSVIKFLHGMDKLTEFNFDATFNAFVSVVHSEIENHASLKRLSRKEQKLKRKPWIITKDISQ